MASGFGTFHGTAVSLGGSGTTGALVSATVSQSVNTTARTVTVTVTAYAGYQRMSGGDWNVSNGTSFWWTDHTDSYLRATIDGTSGSITKSIGVASAKAQTVHNGSRYTIPGGGAKAMSGYSAQKTVSKTFNYDAAGSAITKSWSITLHEYGNSGTNVGWHDATLSGSFTTDSIGAGSTLPTGLTATYNSSTWNSVSITSSVTSWGTGYTGTPNLEQIVVDSSATSSDWQNKGRQVKKNATTSLSSTQSVTTAGSTAYSGGLTIKGAMSFKIAAWASTSVGHYGDGYFNNTTYYTPPAPLQSITYTQTQGSTNVGISTTITGGNSTNNTSNTVTTYYRYSVDGGSTYSNWTSAGTGTAWTAKTASFNCAYGANVVIQAKQQYQGKDSEVKSVSFTATNGTTPSGGSVNITSATWDSVTLNVSGVSYGKPDGISGRKLAIGVRVGPNDASYKRENQVENVTSATTTVTNSSIYPSALPLQLKGMLPVYSYVWAWNTKTSATVASSSTPYYLPPAPGIGSYTDDTHGDYTIKFTGNVSNNVTDYIPADLTRTVRYKIDNGAWVYVDSAAVKMLDALTSAQINVPYLSTATVECWMTYKGKDSEVTRFTIMNAVKNSHLYGSVNGVTEEIEHLYGSVNASTVKINKLYASVGGVATEVFRDV